MAAATSWEDDAVDERPIREAAAAICVRDAGSGDPEVLVVRRSERSHFLPGYITFPGGAIEPDDGDRARRWFGDHGERQRAAALRELVEEVGLALTSSGLHGADGVEPIDADPPDRGDVVEVCHWIAPPEVPVRFDARYFAIRVSSVVEPVVDGREVVHAWWTSPRALLDGWTDGEHKLYWPTWFTVGHLAACASGSEILALRFETREPTEDEQATMPRHVMEQVP
jgi:8-oxo-dGTP pyrophosphatase MutT (NUDIX family)